MTINRFPADLHTPLRAAEARDAIEHLNAHGYGPLMRAIVEPSSLTQSGRIKLSAVARVLDTTKADVREQLQEVRQLIEWL